MFDNGPQTKVLDIWDSPSWSQPIQLASPQPTTSSHLLITTSFNNSPSSKQSSTNKQHRQWITITKHCIVCRVNNYFLSFSVLGAQTRQSPVLIIFYFGLCENDPMHARRTLVLYFTHFVLFFIHRNQRQPTPKTTFSEMVRHLNDDDLMNLIFCKFFGRIDQHNVDYNFGWYETYSFLNSNWLILQILALNLQMQRVSI